jgi:hypothetical protein
VSVPHCIAHQLRMTGNERESAELPKKGAVGESRVLIPINSISGRGFNEMLEVLERARSSWLKGMTVSGVECFRSGI